MSLVPGSVERGTQRVIYAYSHVRTHQVLYSFTPYLHNASVARQFPDTGANTSFTHLRKDLWRPLWTLTIPESDHANAQGRHVFKKLREWRKLHETSWEPPAMLSMNHSKKEIERMQEKLDQRGGSKKNNVYDVIKHNKKKMRVAAVLDQRANSVADLAAVLAAQEELGANTQQSKETESKQRRDFQIQLMLDLAKEAEEGGLEPLEARIRELRKMEVTAKEAGEPMEMSRAQFQRELSEVRLRAKKMRGSVLAVKEATEKIKEANPNISAQQLESRLRETLPGLPTPDGSVPKRGPLRARLARANAPEFSTEGIIIKWANQLDAEYAESWPATIAHQAMGFARHRAPRADQEAVLDVASFRSNVAQAYEAKHGLAPATEDVGAEKKPSEEEVSRKAAVKMVKGRIIEQVRRSVAKSVDRRIRQAKRGLPPVGQVA